jgi:predicted dienelactone hydrolase
MVRVWYPARTRSRMPTTAYLDTISAEYLAGMVPELPVPATEDIATHSVAGARLQRGCQTRPVVLFSPGLQGVVAFYQSLLEDLASQGYIVFGVDSPDVSGVTVFPDGHIIGNQAHERR